MKNISLAKWAEWKRKRRHTFTGFIIVGTIIGMDYSFMFTTLYPYLKDLIQTDKPDVYYGLIIAGYCVSSTVFGALSGRWVDKYRKVKLFTNAVLVLQIIGITLYVIPKSVAFPLVGRLICGIGDPYTSVCSGEVVRIYNQQEGTSALWWLASSYSIGFMIGPVVVICFKDVDFHIAGLHFNQLNVVGFLIIGLLLFALIVANLLVSDCSSMIDLKVYIKENAMFETRGDIEPEINENITINNGINNVTEETSLLMESANSTKRSYSKEYPAVGQLDNTLENSERTDNDYSISVNDHSMNESSTSGSRLSGSNMLASRSTWETQPIRLVLRCLFTNTDALLMFISTFVLVYSLFASDVILPLLTQIILQWSLTSLTVIFVANGVIYFVMVMISSKFCVTDRAVYHMFILSILSVVLTFAIMLLLKMFKESLSACVIMMVLFVLVWALGWVTEEVLIRCTLAKMVPSNCQSFTEAMRNGVSRISMILAAITVPLTLPYLKVWCTGLMAINAVLLISFLARRKHLMLVREIDFQDN